MFEFLSNLQWTRPDGKGNCYNENEYIFTEGDHANKYFFIVSGSVFITKKTREKMLNFDKMHAEFEAMTEE